MPTPLAQLADTVTAPLKDDPELRLDVRREVLAHLEDTAAALQAEGAEKPEAQAARAFGAPEEIAGALLEANARRMKLRALARLCLRAALLPVLAFVAVWIGYNGMARFVDLVTCPLFYHAEEPPMARWPRVDRPPADNDPWKHMGSSRHIGVDELQAEAEGHPGDRAYFWRYADAVRPTTPKDDAGLVRLEAVMREGERLDPDNAYYNYRLAMAWAERAATPQHEKDTKLYHLEVRDRALLDRAMAELRKGLAKPRMESYPPAYPREADLRTTEDGLRHLYAAAMQDCVNSDSPKLSGTEVSRCALPYARLLDAEGRREAAEPYLTAELVFQRQRMADPGLPKPWTAAAGVHGWGQSAAEYYRLRGDTARAARAEALDATMKAFFTARGDEDDYVLPRSSLFLWAWANMFRDAYPTAEGLAPVRRLEYTAMEGGALSLTVALLSALAVICAALSLWWAFGLRRAQARSLLLLPGWRMVAGILGWGVLLPLGLYVAYAHWSPLAGRQWSPFSPLYGSLWRFIGELAAVVLAIVISVSVLAVRAIRRRCRVLGIPTPTGVMGYWRGLLWVILVLLPALLPTAVLIFVPHLTWHGTTPGWSWHPVREPLLILATLAIWVFTIRALVRRWRAGAAQRQAYALYRGTLFRTLVLLYVGAAALVSLVGTPYLAARERACLRQDTAIFYRDEHGLTAAETERLAPVRAQMLDALRAAEAELAAPLAHDRAARQGGD